MQVPARMIAGVLYERAHTELMRKLQLDIMPTFCAILLVANYLLPNVVKFTSFLFVADFIAWRRDNRHHDRIRRRNNQQHDKPFRSAGSWFYQRSQQQSLSDRHTYFKS
ncbi:hypothetical protein BV898_06184 [Hypsibius exemplaris]|uniref:Uncharacterized protein n=1 Tax=Hypsibius exemplaris TaxID=2072580 RepID=A0A1W0WXM6_HYPEX|nr:hypothetical protein BV898_06184 [Hypsibius exemplaris]